jgi:hypothetical protein
MTCLLSKVFLITPLLVSHFLVIGLFYSVLVVVTKSTRKFTQEAKQLSILPVLFCSIELSIYINYLLAALIKYSKTYNEPLVVTLKAIFDKCSLCSN